MLALNTAVSTEADANRWPAADGTRTIIDRLKCRRVLADQAEDAPVELGRPVQIVSRPPDQRLTPTCRGISTVSHHMLGRKPPRGRSAFRIRTTNGRRRRRVTKGDKGDERVPVQRLSWRGTRVLGRASRGRGRAQRPRPRPAERLGQAFAALATFPRWRIRMALPKGSRTPMSVP